MELPREQNWKNYRKGIIIITIVHFVIKIMFDGPKENGSFFSIGPVIINYLFATWFIKSKIKNGFSSKKPFLFGLKVSVVVFIIQIFLGQILYFAVNKYNTNLMALNNNIYPIEKNDSVSIYLDVMPEAVKELNEKLENQTNNIFDSAGFERNDSTLTFYYRMKSFSINEQIEENDLTESDVNQFLINFKPKVKNTVDSFFSTNPIKEYHKHKIKIKYKYYDRYNLQLGEFYLYEK